MAFLDTPNFAQAVKKALFEGATHYTELRILNNELINVSFFEGENVTQQKCDDWLKKWNSPTIDVSTNRVLMEVSMWNRHMESYSSNRRINTIEKSPTKCLADLSFVDDIVKIENGIANLSRFAYNNFRVKGMVMNTGESFEEQRLLYNGYAHKMTILPESTKGSLS